MKRKLILFILCLFASSGAFAAYVTQQGYIDNMVGMGGRRGFNGDNRDALQTRLGSPLGVAVDRWGNIYFSDTTNHRVRMVDIRSGLVSTVAGTGEPGFANDGGHADMAQLYAPTALVFDRRGNLYIADTGNNRVRVVTVKGYLRTVAGDGRQGYLGEGDRAVAAPLDHPTGLAISGKGELHIADTGNNRVRKIDRTTGRLITVAGTGEAGDDGDLGLAVNAKINKPTAIVFDSRDNLFIADTGNHQIRWVEPKRRLIFTIAGTGVPGFSGEGDRKSVDSQFRNPTGLALDSQGRLYIADTDNNRIRRLVINSRMDNKVDTVAGTGKRGYNGDAINAWEADLAYPGAMTITPGDFLFFVDVGNNLVRRVQGISKVDPPKIYTAYGKNAPAQDDRNFVEVLFKKKEKK